MNRRERRGIEKKVRRNQMHINMQVVKGPDGQPKIEPMLMDGPAPKPRTVKTADAITPPTPATLEGESAPADTASTEG